MLDRALANADALLSKLIGAATPAIVGENAGLMTLRESSLFF